jgi:hypothetical protein
MKRHTVHLILGVAAATMLVASSVRASGPELRRNPFDRPVLSLSNNNETPANREATSKGGPLLRAVLVAGSKSVVNFGGVILQIGQSADGYRLLSVDEEGATFSRDGAKVVLSFYEQEPAEDQ